MRAAIIIPGALLALAISGAADARGSGGSHSSGSHSSSSGSGGSHAISGHTTKSGTYVAPSRATNPNSTKRDNYSSRGNVNPYSGKEGTKDPSKP